MKLEQIDGKTIELIIIIIITIISLAKKKRNFDWSKILGKKRCNCIWFLVHWTSIRFQSLNWSKNLDKIRRPGMHLPSVRVWRSSVIVTTRQPRSVTVMLRLPSCVTEKTSFNWTRLSLRHTIIVCSNGCAQKTFFSNGLV